MRIVSFHTPSQGEIPNDRLSPCEEPPRIQWRYRPGFAPGSLFFAAVVTGCGNTQMLLVSVIIPHPRGFVKRHKNNVSKL